VSLNGTCSEGSTVRYLSDGDPCKLCLKQEDFSELFSFKYALLYVISDVG
jgi:hypothetical protein